MKHWGMRFAFPKLLRKVIMMNKYFFFDRGIIQPQATRNFAVRTCKGVKDTENNPLFREDFFSEPSRKWEVRYDNGYPNLFYDPIMGIYRLYYTLFSHDPDSSGTPLENRIGKQYTPRGDRITSTAYAESKDGIHWVKPSLGLVEFEGSTDNNLLMMYAHGTSVMLDEQEIDPSKRYKLMTRVDYPGTRGFMAVSFSADGLHWQELLPWPKHNPQADSHNFVFRDHTDGMYKLITRIWKNGMRVSAMCESSDFIHWSEPKEVLRGSGFANQVYSMPVFRCGKLFLGLASVFHEGDMDDTDFDTVDLELTMATQVDTFDFVAPRDHLIERGAGRYPTGEFDCGCIYASPPVEIDGKNYIYYMGGNGQHTNYRETSFARAAFEIDKWACLVPKNPDKESQVMTSMFHFYGETFEIMADIDHVSNLKVALFNHYRDQEPIEGYGFEDAALEPGENGYFRVRFSKPLMELSTKNPRIVIKSKNAKLYAIRGELAISTTR